MDRRYLAVPDQQVLYLVEFRHHMPSSSKQNSESSHLDVGLHHLVTSFPCYIHVMVVIEVIIFSS